MKHLVEEVGLFVTKGAGPGGGGLGALGRVPEDQGELRSLQMLAGMLCGSCQGWLRRSFLELMAPLLPLNFLSQFLRGLLVGLLVLHSDVGSLKIPEHTSISVKGNVTKNNSHNHHT